MSQNHIKTTEKSISEQLQEVWPLLSVNQRRYVIARLEYSSKKEAAEAIDVEPDTVYRWPDVVEKAVELATIDAQSAAVAIIAAGVAKAAMIKLSGLDSDDEKIRQAVATEFLDRQLGKAASRTEITGPDGDELTIKVKYADADDYAP